MGASVCPRVRLSLMPNPNGYERDRAGRPFGLDVDIARELSARSGCELVIEETNAARLWPRLSAGEIPLSGGVALLPERKALVEYLLLFRLRGLVLMPRALGTRVATRAAFDLDPALRLGVLRQGRRSPDMQAWVDGLVQQERVSLANDNASLLRAYEAGRVDAILCFAVALAGRSAEWLEAHVLQDWWSDSWVTFGWAASLKGMDEDTRTRLRDAIGEMRRDGTLQRLVQRHWGLAGAQHYAVL